MEFIKPKLGDVLRGAYARGVKNRAAYGLRTSPFYEEKVTIKGVRYDITAVLGVYYFAGYDGLDFPDPNALDPKTDTLSAQQSQPANA